MITFCGKIEKIVLVKYLMETKFKINLTSAAKLLLHSMKNKEKNQLKKLSPLINILFRPKPFSVLAKNVLSYII